ncbi:MAG: ABC transporter ATP-binding protein [Alteraurantiacibacter sp.]
MTRVTPIRRLLREAPPRETAVLFSLMLAARLTEGVGILLLVPILDSLRGAGEPSQLSGWLGTLLPQGAAIGPLLAVFVVLVMIRSLLVFSQQVQSVRYQNRVIDRLRERCFDRLLRAEWRWLSGQRASDHANALTTGIGRVGMGLNTLITLAAMLATSITYVAVALILSWQITLLAAVVGLVAHAALGRIRRRAVTIGINMGITSRAVQASIQEGLAGIRLTKILRNEDRHLASFADTVARQREEQVRFAISSGSAQRLVDVGGAVLLAGLIYLGVTWWTVPLATLLTIVLVFSRLMPQFGAIQQSLNQWHHAAPALDDLDQVMIAASANAEPPSPPHPAPLPLASGIELRGVTVAYAERPRPALANVSLTIAARSTTALIGQSGAGKSTLADVLMALIVPDEGQVLVDGEPLTASDRHRLRAAVSYVQQDAFLFNDSVRANLLWSYPEASEADLREALSAAAAEFAYALPEGLDTTVGDGGVRLSGGERQRIALARALLGQPALLILDEATSALDPANEALVRAAIRQLHGSLTIVLIGHRLSQLDQVDQVVELRGGNVVRCGPPDGSDLPQAAKGLVA